jgi:tetratricopeptide (TPR) repeat protein
MTHKVFKLSATFVAVGVWVFILSPLTVAAQQSPNLSPREQLNQYVADLQKNPSDDALREKIIRLALTLQPPPAVPREAKEAEGAAEYAFKNAQSNSDFAKAAGEYEKALLSAPWVAGYYYNLAFSWEKASESHKALAAYQLYLIAAPNAKDSDDVVKKIGALKYALQQQQEQQQAQAATRSAAEQERERQRKLEGRYVYKDHYERDGRVNDQDYILDVRGGQVTSGDMITFEKGFNSGRVGVYRAQWTVPLNGNRFHYEDAHNQFDGIISEDGSSITETSVNSYATKRLLYHRQ